MESSKEKIEAQLCDYVEGELDDAQRAEIEQHLAANPHHQALIAELRAASGLLRDLPRVKAPIELNESLCGQLERSALLDPNEEAYDPARSVNRWPQFAAVAAVLMLAAGLAFVVMYVLPPSGGNAHNQVAIDESGLKKQQEKVTDAPVRENGREVHTDAEKQTELGQTVDRKVSTEALAPSSEPTRRAMKMAAPAPAPSRGGASGVQLRTATDDLNVARMPENQRGMVSAAEVENVRKWMNASLGADNTFFKPGAGNSLYLVVSTTNTSAANGQLAAYFKTNGIQYMEDETRLPALGTTAVADGRDATKKLEALQYDSKFGVRAGAGGDAAAKDKSTPDHGTGAAAGGTENFSRNTPAPGAAPDAAGRDNYAFRGGTSGFGRGEDLKRESGNPAKPPSAPENAATENKTEVPVPAAVAAKPVAVNGRRADLAEAGGVKGAGAEGLESRAGEVHDAAQPMVIVARMNRRQANELSAALSKQEGQHAELKQFAPPAVSNALQSVTTGAVASANGTRGASSDSDSLSLDRDAPKELAKSGAAAPETERVLGDRTAEPAGKESVEQKTRSLALGAGGPATAPASQGVATSAPIDLGADALHLSVDPLDEPVDVVIFVKKEAGATTVPATAKPQIDGAP